MKVFSTLADLKAFSENLYEYYHGNMLEITEDAANVDNEKLEDLVGGEINIVETAEDLKQITTTEQNKDGQYLDVTEASSSFDMCARHPTRYDLIEFFMATHNGGGHIYLVPDKFMHQYPTIQECMDKTKEAWEG